ncbi:MAG: PAS domain S-box protein [Desulfomonile tiedjei]|uniref:PAS domain S-box protein n=1 Tax=Desulfomonile tiedjei TaxID=2358 RepID=A0A9D6Z339_9BACT|nr:PAS domain S-box protein [Desulfomonile tiedjei]
MNSRMRMVIGGSVIAGLAFIMAAVLQRTAHGSLQIWEVILSLVLVCAAGVLVRNYFSKRTKIGEYSAGDGERQASEPLANQPKTSVQGEAILHKGPEASPIVATETERTPETRVTLDKDQSQGTVEDAKMSLPKGDPDVEIRSIEQDLPEKPIVQTKEGELELRLEERKALYLQKIEELEIRTAEQHVLEQELRKRKEFLTSCIDNASIFFAVIDTTGKTVMMNRRMSGSLGYAEDEVTNVDFVSNFIPERLRQDVWPGLIKCSSEDNEPIKTESFVLSKLGSEIPVEWLITRGLDSAGRVSNCFIVGIEITERKKSEEKVRDSEHKVRALYEKAITDTEYYRSVLDSCLDAIAVYDTESKPRYVNPAFTRSFGWTAEELLKDHAEFVPVLQNNLEKPAMDGLIKSGSPLKDFETKRSSKDGRIVPIRLTASLIHDQQGDAEGILIVLREALPEKEVEKPSESRPPQVIKRQIKTKEVVKDIRSGATDSQIMEKFRLSTKDLQTVFQKLLQANVLTSQEIQSRGVSRKEPAAIGVGAAAPVETILPPQETNSATTNGVTQVVGTEVQAKEPSGPESERDGALKLSAVPVVVQDEEKMEKPEPESGVTEDSPQSPGPATILTMAPSSMGDQNDSLLTVTTFIELAEDSLVPRRMIIAREVAGDVHTGMGDTLLMEKYELSAKQLNHVLRKLLDEDLISDMQLYERTSLSDSQVTKAFVEKEKAIEELEEP